MKVSPSVFPFVAHSLPLAFFAFETIYRQLDVADRVRVGQQRVADGGTRNTKHGAHNTEAFVAVKSG